jgi:hypothetical protein
MNVMEFFTGVNWLSVIAVTLLSFVLGSLWHSKLLFGKAWTEDAKPVFDKTQKINLVKLFGLTAIFHFAAIISLDVFIGPQSTFFIGLQKGFFISVVWVSTSIGATHLFAGRPFRLILIDAGFYIVFFSMAGLILGAW